MRNPFYSTELPLTAPFCDREKELKELTSHAVNRANVVLYSPRRYGKTSLVKRVQAKLAQEGAIAVYVDFFGVDSVETMAQRLATVLYSHYSKDMSLLRKVALALSSWRPVIRVSPDADTGFMITAEPTVRTNGMDLLHETLSQFGKFTQDHKKGFHVVFDEFQEIIQLPDSLKIEGVMRSHVQGHSNVSYFFVGSRRRLLMDIFNGSKRAFYKSAINYPLPPLPKEEAITFIVERFLAGGKKCPEEMAEQIFDLVGGYPYYVQKIPYAIHEVAEGDVITHNDLTRGLEQVHEDEKPVYESYLQAISPVQIRLLGAIADDPTASPYSMEYMGKHHLGSVGGVQGALGKLVGLDYIERDARGTYRVVDPVFTLWLRRSAGVMIEGNPM
ncbi:MAG: ATP-binding protein [Syntrophorhabdaceae bacterium]|nr:ATP-binding protein [Syntrophorhabdaceae bacterium]